MNQPKSQKNKFRFSLSEIALFFLCAVVVVLLLTPSLMARYKLQAELNDPNARIAKFSGEAVHLTLIEDAERGSVWHVGILNDSPFGGNLQVAYDGSGNEVSTYVIVAVDGHHGWDVRTEEQTGEDGSVKKIHHLRVPSLDSTEESVIEWKLAVGWEYGGSYTYTETTKDGEKVERIVHAFLHPVKYGKTLETMLFADEDVAAFAAGGSETEKSIRSNKDLNWLNEVGSVPVEFEAYVMQKEGDAKYAFEAFRHHMRHYSATP